MLSLFKPTVSGDEEIRVASILPFIRLRADFDDDPMSFCDQVPPPAPHAYQLAQPDKRVVQHGHDPQPRRVRRTGLGLDAGLVWGDFRHAENL